MLTPLLAIVLAAAAVDAAADSPLVAQASDARVEAFLMERPTEEGPQPLAVIVLRALEGETGPLLEQDVSFRAGGVRILQVEQREPDGWRLVRRELRGPASPGRSCSGEPDGAGGLRLLRWGASVPVHETWPAAPRLLLELLESLRLGGEPSGRISLYDPLTEAVVPVDLLVTPGDSRNVAPEPEARTAELHREDGSLVGRYVFHGDELIAFQWQPGERWARRIELAEAQRRSASWRIDHDPTAEIWAAVSAGRVQRR